MAPKMNQCVKCSISFHINKTNDSEEDSPSNLRSGICRHLLRISILRFNAKINSKSCKKNYFKFCKKKIKSCKKQLIINLANGVLWSYSSVYTGGRLTES